MTPKAKRRVSDDAVQARTGRRWGEWFTILDRAGARRMDHATIARYLSQMHRLPGWWSQTVSVQYECERGLREPPPKRVIVPEDLRLALARNAKAKAAFERIPPSHKRAYVEWITEAKRPETRERRIAESVKRLAAARRLGDEYRARR